MSSELEAEVQYLVDDVLEETDNGYVATDALTDLLNRHEIETEPDWAPLARELRDQSKEALEAKSVILFLRSQRHSPGRSQS